MEFMAREHRGAVIRQQFDRIVRIAQQTSDLLSEQLD
jgi:hypothetical protein